MTWQILVVTYLALSTAAYLLRRSLAVNMTKYNRIINAFYMVAVLYPLGLIVAAFTGAELAVGWENFLFLLIGSGLFTLTYLFSFKASRDIDAGFYTVIHNITPIITITAATLLLNESLNRMQMFAAAIILFSAFLATSPNLKNRKTSKLIGLEFAFAAIFCLGLGVVFERWMLTRVGFGAYLVYGWGAQTLWMGIVAWGNRHQLMEIFKDRKQKYSVLGYSFTNAIKGLVIVAALNFATNVSLVSAYLSFQAVLVVLAAYFVLYEREYLWLKIASAVVGCAGLVLLNAA